MHERSSAVKGSFSVPTLLLTLALPVTGTRARGAEDPPRRPNVAFVYTDRQARIYNSSTTLSVSGEPLEYFLDLAAKNRLAPLKPVITSGEVATRAIGANSAMS